jgi:hypothetical protein
MGILKTIGLILVAIAIVVWVERSFLTGLMTPGTTASRLSATPLMAAGNGTGYDTRGTFDTSGSIVIDDRVTPSVPFIMYQTPEGETRTKHLVFSSGTTCSSYAGDLPCATHNGRPDVPVSAGQYVHIHGTANEDRVYVDYYTVISAPSVR